MTEILISPKYGAGWSTWADEEFQSFMLFDKGLIELAKKGAEEYLVEEYIQEKLGDVYIYTGGWSDIEVIQLPEGTKFTVNEYDGSESLKTSNCLEFTA